jgi:hypothetical protein
MKVTDTGSPIAMPIGEDIKGRLFNVIGEAIVGIKQPKGTSTLPIHDEVMPARGLTFAGPHHEVYLSDPRRTAPEKLRTILRQPVKPV